MNFINLCPHALRLRSADANTESKPDPTDIVVAPFEGADGKPTPARVAAKPGASLGILGGIAVYDRTSYGVVEGLPAPQKGVIYLVSALVAGRPEVAGRRDVFVPGTGPKDGAVRDGAGQIYAVTRLVKAG